MKKKWWQEAVVYQIYCKSFCASDGNGIGNLPGRAVCFFFQLYFQTVSCILLSAGKLLLFPMLSLDAA